MKPKINSKVVCMACETDVRCVLVIIDLIDILFILKIEHLIGRLLIRGKWNKIPKYILRAIKLRKREIKQ